MVAMRLASLDDVRFARAVVRDLAEALGLRDPEAAALAAGELGRNCLEHGSQVPGLLWIRCQTHRLTLRFENRCEQRPNWCTQKPVVVDGFRIGGYGLPLVRALAGCFNCRWADGRVIVCAEFG
jgi:anti-sigma regulatory factor (Ser/Thr protein kinase)